MHAQIFAQSGCAASRCSDDKEIGLFMICHSSAVSALTFYRTLAGAREDGVFDGKDRDVVIFQFFRGMDR
jgi:hypothetical protein